jgi:inorganic pyrophosphatase
MNPASALTTKGVNLLSPIVFASVLFGAMVPYWSAPPLITPSIAVFFLEPFQSDLTLDGVGPRFSALTMRSVGEAAHAMVKEVARQFAEIKVPLPRLATRAPAAVPTRSRSRPNTACAPAVRNRR